MQGLIFATLLVLPQKIETAHKQFHNYQFSKSHGLNYALLAFVLLQNLESDTCN